MSGSPSVVSDHLAVPSPPVPAPAPSKPDLVLLIEDDEFVSGVLARVLARIALRVIRAKNGTEGAHLFATNERNVGLVILDCGLPDVDGAALGRVFRRIAPKLPIILTSGWDNEAARAQTADGPTVFLQKPFVTSEIEAHVKSLLGAIT